MTCGDGGGDFADGGTEVGANDDTLIVNPQPGTHGCEFPVNF